MPAGVSYTPVRMNRHEERVVRVMELLEAYGRVDLQRITDELRISEATARRLFARLEEAGEALRVHGGIALPSPAGRGYSYQAAALARVREKSAIGRTAALLVQSGDHLFLDSGTTVLRLAEQLANRLDSGSLGDVVVVTNSLAYTGILASRCRTILVGGEIRPDRNDVCGPLAERELAGFHVQRAFLGADALHLEHGAMATDERTARMNEVVMTRADATVVLADSSKFTASSFVAYAPLASLHEAITDDLIPEELRTRFLDAGLSLTVAEVERGFRG
jgi:DeoR/GlpR family transcriptional regulator of sugar metabolism